MRKEINLITSGMGIVLYSIKGMSYIEEGTDYFSDEFSDGEKVASHIKNGDIIGFNMGTPGEFNLHIREGYPNKEINEGYPLAIRLALKVYGNKVAIVDLFWLMEWSNDIPKEQIIELDEGIYHVTVLTRKPKCGWYGNEQDVYIYFNRVNEMPKLSWEGIPTLFK